MVHDALFTLIHLYVMEVNQTDLSNTTLRYGTDTSTSLEPHTAQLKYEGKVGEPCVHTY